MLIHEATFENARIEDARAKRHSTVEEAAEAGRAVCTRALVLTHLSQRYPFSLPVEDLRGAGRILAAGGEAEGVVLVCARDLVCLRRWHRAVT